MRKNIVLTAIVSALLLTGCDKETEFIDDLETTKMTVPAQSTQTAETEGETQYILGGKTETAVSENETAETEIPQGIRLFDFGKLNTETKNEGVSVSVHGSFLNGNILCAFCEIRNGDEHIRYILRFYNTENETVEKTLRLPTSSYKFVEFIGGGEDILCKLRLRNNGSKFDDYFVITVKNDYSYEREEYTPQTAAVPVCGHNVAQWYIDIIDADRDIKIVEGVESEGDGYDPNSRSQRYMFPAGENSFVYFSLGYESMPGFGIYDFETDTATDVTNSENLLPIGVHGGKVYSVKTAWDGFGTELYTTDTKTFETEFFTDYPFELEQYALVEYAMSEDGSKIAVLKSGYQVPQALYIIDPDTAEIISEYEIEEAFHYNSGVYFADSDTVALQNWWDKIMIIPLDECLVSKYFSSD